MKQFKDNEENTKDELTSKFNEGLAQIARLNISWMKCNQAASSGNLSVWKWELDNVWRELAADAKQKNEEKYFNENAKLNLKIAIAQRKSRALLYKFLEEKMIFLRCLQDDVGKGSSKTSMDEDSFD